MAAPERHLSEPVVVEGLLLVQGYSHQQLCTRTLCDETTFLHGPHIVTFNKVQIMTERIW